MCGCDNYIEQLLTAIFAQIHNNACKSFSSAQAELTCVFAFSTNTHTFIVSRKGGKGK